MCAASRLTRCSRLWPASVATPSPAAACTSRSDGDRHGVAAAELPRRCEAARGDRAHVVRGGVGRPDRPRRRRGGRVHIGERAISCRHVVDAAGAWGDVLAARCGVAPLGLLPMRRTAALVPAPAEVAAWPLVMDVAGRYYLEPEAGGLLVSPADETPSEPCDARAEELDVALALERVAAADRAHHAHRAYRLGRPADVRAGPRAGDGRGSGRAGLLVARRPGRRRHQDVAGARRDARRTAITGSAATPPVAPALLSPSRLRS